MSVLNGTLSAFRDGRRGFFGDNDRLTGVAGGGSGSVVLDNAAIPTYPTAPQTEGVWYGTNTRASCSAGGATNVCLGNGATVGTNNNTAVGVNARAAHVGGDGCVAVGKSCLATGQNSYAIGLGCAAAGDSGLALGTLCIASGSEGVAIGTNGSVASALQTLALGGACNAGHANAICIGTLAASAQAGDVCIGTSAISAGAGNPKLTLGTQFVPTVAAAGASDVYLAIRINNVNYKLLLHT